MSSLHYFLGYRNHLRHVLQQCCTCTAASHRFYRATIINVNQVGVHFCSNSCRLGHVANIATKQLDADRPLVLKDVELLFALGSMTDESFRRNEFSVHQVGATFFTNGTEGGIAHIFHGSEE